MKPLHKLCCISTIKYGVIDNFVSVKADQDYKLIKHLNIKYGHLIYIKSRHDGSDVIPIVVVLLLREVHENLHTIILQILRLGDNEEGVANVVKESGLGDGNVEIYDHLYTIRGVIYKIIGITDIHHEKPSLKIQDVK